MFEYVISYRLNNKSDHFIMVADSGNSAAAYVLAIHPEATIVNVLARPSKVVPFNPNAEKPTYTDNVVYVDFRARKRVA